MEAVGSRSGSGGRRPTCVKRNLLLRRHLTLNLVAPRQPFALQIAPPPALAAPVAFRRVELLAEGHDVAEALAALAPLEVRTRVPVHPEGLVAVPAHVLVLLRDHGARLPVRRPFPAHDAPHAVLRFRALEVDELLVGRGLARGQSLQRRELGHAVGNRELVVGAHAVGEVHRACGSHRRGGRGVVVVVVRGVPALHATSRSRRSNAVPCTCTCAAAASAPGFVRGVAALAGRVA
mmetsp:Transcript_21983/g.37139  ORF Transcript_21983/g.37139 Transcript_21983/m.37139 type:complete len:235 (-) Transcript_21983:232-936(-)